MTYRLAYMIALLTAGCAGDDPFTVDNLPACETTTRAYRIDTLDLPASLEESEGFGWDLDDDGSIDNQGGNIISAIDGYLEVDLQVAVDEALDADLVQITIDQCADPDYAVATVYRGLTIDRSVDPPRMVVAPATDRAALAREELPAAATEGAARFPVGQLIHASVDTWIEARDLVVDTEWIDDEVLEGRMAAALDQPQAFDVATEALHAKIEERLEELGPCTAEACDELLLTLMGIYDANDDYEITLEELRTNDLNHTLLDADVDTDDDGEDDGYSIGLGFSASPVELIVEEGA